MVLYHESLVIFVFLFIVGLILTSSIEDNEIIQCLEEQFKCKDGFCIEKVSLCDGFTDCLDGSDEDILQCANMRCPLGLSFQCAYGGCIDAEKKCDGKPDCIDSSDEDLDLCGYKKCPSNLFECGNGQCIDKNKVCNKKKDCADGLDESFAHCGITKIKGDCEYPDQPQNGMHIPIDCYTEEQFPIDKRFTEVDEVCLEFLCNDGFVLDEYKTRYITKCVDGKWAPSIPTCIECGRNSRVKPLIYIPSEIPKHPEPWHVGIYVQNLMNNKFEYKCGGTIVHSRAIVSAAHCFKYFPVDTPYVMENLFDISQIKFAVGKVWREFTRNESLQQVLEVQEVRHHEEFSFLFGMDIVVVIVKEKITMTKAIMPVCIGTSELYKEYNFSSTMVKGKVVGFGTTDTMKLSERLLAATLTICCGPQLCTERTDQVCRRDKEYITKDKFCVEIYENATRLGEGDSGGGFIIVKRNINYLYGIVSLETSCRQHVLFTSIPMVLEWLQYKLQP